MTSFDIDPLFTNLPLKDIYVNKRFRSKKKIKGMNKK